MRNTAEIQSPAIIRDVSLLGQNLPRGLPNQVGEKIMSTCKSLRQKAYQEYGNRLVTTLSCYLAVTGEVLSDHLPHQKNSAPWLGLIGALNSTTFVELPSQTRYIYTRVAVEVAKKLWPRETAFTNLTVSSIGPTASIETLLKKFETIKLNDEQVQLWRGWPVVDAAGHVRWLPLHSVAVRHGMPFANALCEVIANYWAGTRRQKDWRVAAVHSGVGDFP